MTLSDHVNYQEDDNVNDKIDIDNYDDVDDFFYIKMSSGADYTLVITSVTMEDDAKFQCQVFQNHKNSFYHSGTRPR